jgi:hypothetical protein
VNKGVAGPPACSAARGGGPERAGCAAGASAAAMPALFSGIDRPAGRQKNRHSLFLLQQCRTVIISFCRLNFIFRLIVQVFRFDCLSQN